MSEWISVKDRLPDVAVRFDKPCALEGKELPPLNRSHQVIVFDGYAVRAIHIEWFDGGEPINGITHWKPLPDAPTKECDCS
ncbi:TPA: DUF551 domain-containing protein [Pseudomonas aeruginosa]|nr:DUF551 domain-containing protein [Pseudomonas aeruginosa]